MLKLAALLTALVFASPALAFNELLGEPLSSVEARSATHGVSIEKLSEADTITMDAGTNPRPRPSEIHLMTLGNSVIILLVHNGAVIFSSDPIELAKINKILNRSGV